MAVAASLRQLTQAQRYACAKGWPPWVGLCDDGAAVEPGGDVYSVGAPILGLLPSAEEWADVGFPGTGAPGDSRQVPPWTARLYRCPEALRAGGMHPAIVLVRVGHPGMGNPSGAYPENPPWWSLVPPVTVLEKLAGGSGPTFRCTSFRQLGEFNRWWNEGNASSALPWPTGAPLGGVLEHTASGYRYRYPGQLERRQHPAGTFDLIADPYAPAGAPG